MYRDHVTVPRVSFRRRGTAEILDHVVITDVERPFGQAGTAGAGRARLEFGRRRGDAEHDPVPPTGTGRRVRVEQGHREVLVCAGKPDHDSEGEMFLPVMPNPSKTWFCDIIWVSATSSLRSLNDGTAGMKS